MYINTKQVKRLLEKGCFGIILTVISDGGNFKKLESINYTN